MKPKHVGRRFVPRHFYILKFELEMKIMDASIGEHNLDKMYMAHTQFMRVCTPINLPIYLFTSISKCVTQKV